MPLNITWNGITFKGVLLGFLLAGVIGFLANRILWKAGIGGIRAFFKPQSVSQRTGKSPFRVFLNFLRGIAIVGVFILSIPYLTGVLADYPPFLPVPASLMTLRSDQIAVLLLVGFIISIIALGLKASSNNDK